MALVIPGGYALGSITVTGADGTQPFVTTVGVNTNLLEDNNLQLGANALMDAYCNAFEDLTFAQWTISKASLFVVTEDGSGSVDSTLIPRQGTRSGRPEPISMALVARKVTGGFGRTGRGRMFIPGVLDEGNVTPAGTLEASTVATFNEALETFHDELTTDGEYNSIPPFLLHSDTSPVIAPTPIIRFTPAPLVGWIRKRIR